MTTHLIETFEDGIATLTFNRPEARSRVNSSRLFQPPPPASPSTRKCASL
jgi:hypothetical protein